MTRISGKKAKKGVYRPVGASAYKSLRAIDPEVRRRQLLNDLEANYQWQSHAACRDLDPEKFTVQTSGKRNREDLPWAVGVCKTLCPVRAECLDASNSEDRHYTVRGGRYPRIWAGPGTTQPIPGQCKEGHDLTIPGARNASNSCATCHPDPEPGGLHRIGQECRHGHTLDEANLTKRGKCRTCHNLAKVRWRQRAKMKDAAASQASLVLSA